MHEVYILLKALPSDRKLGKKEYKTRIPQAQKKKTEIHAYICACVCVCVCV